VAGEGVESLKVESRKDESRKFASRKDEREMRWSPSGRWTPSDNH
jgi:hypothetical protein